MESIKVEQVMSLPQYFLSGFTHNSDPALNEELHNLTKRTVQRLISSFLRLALVIIAFLGTINSSLAATLTVLNALDKGAGSLRATIAAATDGDTIAFHPSLTGQVIILTSDQLSINKGITIQGPGANRLTISGNDNNRVFNVSEQANVIIAGLTISHGAGKSGNGGGGDRGGGGGGAILNAGNLSVANCTFSFNLGMNHGGAIANAPFAVLAVVNSSFIGNQALSRDPNAITEGGAIYNSNRGNVTMISGSTFGNNRAVGGDNGLGSGGGLVLVGQCNGGAIHNGLTSVLIAEDCTFTENQAIAGSGGNAANTDFAIVGGAIGGAIANDENCDGGALVVRRCAFFNNQAIAGSNNIGSLSGSGYAGTAGGGAIYQGGMGTIAESSFVGNHALGGQANKAGPGVVGVGLALGGGINNAYLGICTVELNLSGCVFTNNLAIGGAENAGGTFPGAAMGGVLANAQGATATLKGITMVANQAIGGAGVPGGRGGDGFGGGLASRSAAVAPVAVMILGSTISRNAAIGGGAGPGGTGGAGFGGGVYVINNYAACRDTLTFISGNTASTSSNDVFGLFATCP